VKRYAIAVAGMSGSGKTTLAEAVAHELGAALLRTDDYYRPLDHLTYDQRCEINFDHPDSVDGARVARDLRQLLEGQTIEVADYDFTRHTCGDLVRRIEPSEYVVVEGIFALAYEEVVGLCDVRAFVDAEESTCLQRRIARDVTERGRTPGEVISRFEGHVAPMFRRHVLPARSLANVIVSGEENPAAGKAKVLAAMPGTVPA
jgi:uridine kinase